MIRLDMESKNEFVWAQKELVKEVERQYNQRKPVRIITLKARQLGISTVTEGIIFNWCFIHPGTNGLVIAHENEASTSLFDKTRLYWDTWPFKDQFQLKYSTKRSLNWLETRSHLKVATAKNVQSGRGNTFQAVHASECAFYPDPATLMTGLGQTIPNSHGTLMVLESTANGTGNWWHKQWLAAEAGDSDFVPLFFPWYRHFEYKMHTTLNVMSELTPEEKRVIRLGGTYENVQWYRWALTNRANGDEQKLMQEYPTTPEDAFISTGQPLFPMHYLKEIYTKISAYTGLLIDTDTGKGVKFVTDPGGDFTVFKAPHKDNRSDRYFVAGDPSLSVEGDYSCIQVINRETMEQVAVWRARIDPINFGKEMIRVGKYYNNAMLCPEVEGGGQATIATILNMNYPNVWMHRWTDKSPGKLATTYGWSTSYNRKQWAIGTLQRLIIDKSLSIHDIATYQELQDYVVRDNGTWGNSGAEDHDDTVMALAIAVTASIAEGPFIPNRPIAPIHDIFFQEDEYAS